MTPKATQLTGNIAAGGDFFSCTASAALSSPRASLPLRAKSFTQEDILSVTGQQLGSLMQQIQSVTDRATVLVYGRSERNLAVRPRPEDWSAAECFDHLARTTHAFLPPIVEAIAVAPQVASQRRLRLGAVAGLHIRSLEPPYRLKHKVLAQLAPQSRVFAPAWSAFLESQSQLVDTICSAAGLAIDRVKIESPVCARVTYNAYGALGILAAHQRRHLWQAEQALRTVARMTA